MEIVSLSLILMNKLVYILSLLIYIQAIFGLSLDKLDMSKSNSIGTTTCHVNINSGSKSCCATQSNVQTKETTKSCCSSTTKELSDDYGSCSDNCGDNCECTCCQHTSTVFATFFAKEIKLTSSPLFGEIILGMNSFHAYDYKYEEFIPPKLG